MNVLERARGFVDRTLARARPYRFEGEQENHADLLRERRVSLSMMAGADAANPDQQRMASEIEHDAEARLTVLLGKPQLTLEEKRERDAIQTALQQRRAGFGDAPVIVARTGGWTPPRFLTPLAGVQLWHVLAVGWAVTFGLLGLQSARVASLKGDVREMAEVAADNQAAAARWQERAEEYREGLVDAANVARQAADALQDERERQARAAARERRRNREIANVITGAPEPPDWRLRDTGGQAEGDGSTP